MSNQSSLAERLTSKRIKIKLLILLLKQNKCFKTYVELITFNLSLT